MSVRFFTSLALRPEEEVDASLLPWLSQWATVEFDGDRPLTAVWQTAKGQRRVCWYGDIPADTVRSLHAERYGDEPFWLVSIGSEPRRDQIDVVAWNSDLIVVARHSWTFDRMGQPASERMYAPSGELRCSRAYTCLSDGTLLTRKERCAPDFVETTQWRVPEPPVPELTARPFPAGATLGDGTARLLETIVENQCQARCRAVHWRDGAWHPAVATIATMTSSALARLRPVLDLAADGIAPLLACGKLERARLLPDVTFYGIVEALPSGRSVDEIVAMGPVEPRAALDLAIQVGTVARRAHDEGTQLGGIRPELVFVKERAAAFELTGIAHRGPAFLRAAHVGETHLTPPAFLSEFSARDDVAALAQLLWFMATADHPFLARGDITWRVDHNGHHSRARQPWRGPARWEPLLERCLFGDATRRPSLDELLAELSTFVEPAHPYR